MYIDDDDYQNLKGLDLYENKHGYIIVSVDGRRTGLHRIIMNAPKDKEVDHIDGNKKNNQKYNLRLCERKDNARNRRKWKDGSSKYKGVCWRKDNNNWLAYINDENLKRKNLGFFDDEVMAANCYNYYAKLNYGEFALLNDVPFIPKEIWEKNMRVKDKTSKYRGVSFVKDQWLAQIWDGERNIRIGSFAKEIDAAIAYNVWAEQIFGNKAKLNNIES